MTAQALTEALKGRFPDAVKGFHLYRGDGTVTRVDPDTHETESIRVGNSPAGLAAVGDEVWVTVQPSLAAARRAPALAAQPRAATPAS